MYRPGRHIRLAATAIALVVAAATPAVAGQANTGFDLSQAAAGLPPAADTGKPALTLPPALSAPDPDACLPALPCGTRLLGEIRKDGAIVLQVPALRW